MGAGNQNTIAEAVAPFGKSSFDADTMFGKAQPFPLVFWWFSSSGFVSAMHALC